MDKLDGKIDAVFADMNVPHHSGAALLAIDHDEINYTKCCGLADLEAQRPIATDTSFYVKLLGANVRWHLALSVSLFLIVALTTITWGFEPRFDVFVESPARPVVIGTTTLPDGTKLLITIRREASAYMAQSNGVVTSGRFRSEQFSQDGGDLNPGTYSVQVLMPVPAVQSDAVRSVIGEEGENLSGHLVHKGIIGTTVEFTKTFVVGSGRADVDEDAAARDASGRDLERWIVKSCYDSIDWTNNMVSAGVVRGPPIAGAARESKAKTCIADLEAAGRQ